jgi:dolichol-phosphate mannosyltransferase
VNQTERILVFIPAYRCERQIGRALAQFTPEIQRRFAEVVVIDNRSPDGTADRAKAALEGLRHVRVSLLVNDENYSLGGSHKVAFNRALEQGYNYVIVFHGDDQGSIAELIPQLDAGAHRTNDSLLGSRFAEGSKTPGYSRFRVFGNIVFNWLISLVARRRLTDMGSGLNMYTTAYLRSRFYLRFPNDLTFNVFMLYYGVWSRSTFRFFPLTWREDDQVSNAKVFRQAWIILKLTGRYIANARRLFQQDGAEYATRQYSTKVVFTREAEPK